MTSNISFDEAVELRAAFSDLPGFLLEHGIAEDANAIGRQPGLFTGTTRHV